uniref:Uncharacterized protein n=1 Tax=Podoviridae sp. ctG4L18 TaxID=2825234 RepID=A0A8S5UPA3_9CAUD|nr:MAG TPA: hypothetical protein [Podoviridae sp. ctG4L18]
MYFYHIRLLLCLHTEFVYNSFLFPIYLHQM